MHSLTCNQGNMASVVPYISQMMGYPPLIYSTGHQFLMHLLEKSQKYSNLLLLINSFRKTKRHKYSQVRACPIMKIICTYLPTIILVGLAWTMKWVRMRTESKPSISKNKEMH